MSSGSSNVLGKSAMLRGEWRGSFGAFLAAVRPQPEKMCAQFLSHYLRTPEFRLWASSSSGIGIKNIRASDLKAFQIPLPPLPEQKRIAGILDQADALRRLRARALEKLNTLGQAIFQEMFGDGAEFPQYMLSNLVRTGDKINYGVVQPGDEVQGGIPLLRAGDVLLPELDPKKFRTISASTDEKHRKSRLQGDEILIACVGSIGAVALAHKGLLGVNIARAVARVPSDPSKIDRIFLAAQLQTKRVQDYFNREIRLVAQPTLNIKQIAEAPIFLPPMDKQKRFSLVIDEATERQRIMVRASQVTESLFTSLQHRAFRGEL